MLTFRFCTFDVIPFPSYILYTVPSVRAASTSEVYGDNAIRRQFRFVPLREHRIVITTTRKTHSIKPRIGKSRSISSDLHIE